MTDSPALWIRLELDPGTAAFYGLPIKVYVPSGSNLSFGEGTGPRLSMPALARALDAAAASNPEMNGRVDVLRFLNRWPRIEDLERFLRIGNREFADRVARHLLEEDPRDPVALAGLGLLAIGQRRWNEARDHYARVLEVAPSHVPSILEHAVALAGGGNPGEATRLVRDLARQPRAETLARLWLHEFSRATPDQLADRLGAAQAVFRQLESSPTTEEQLDLLEKHFPANPEVLFLRAVHAGARLDGRTRDALLREVLTVDPDHGPARVALAGLERMAGRVPEAETLVREGLERRPEHADLRAVLGQILEQQQRSDEARAAFRRIFEGPLAQVSSRSLGLAGQGLLRLAPGEETRMLFEDTREARPGDPLPPQLLARLDEHSGDRSAAERRLRDALRDCGPLPSLQYALGDLLRREERPAEAEGLFKVLVQRHPASPWGHRGLGDLLLAEQPARAVEHYARALSVDPWTPIPGHDYLRGVAALREGGFEEARDWFSRAVAGEPDNPRYWGDLGAARYFHGDLDGAIEATLRAASLAPTHPGFAHNLAAYTHERFRRAPLREWQSWWKARRLSRRARHLARKSGASSWEKDLWSGPDSPPGDPLREAPRSE